MHEDRSVDRHDLPGDDDGQAHQLEANPYHAAQSVHAHDNHAVNAMPTRRCLLQIKQINSLPGPAATLLHENVCVLGRSVVAMLPC